MEAMKKWPVDLIAKILKDIGIKELCQLKLVSKFFEDFITSHSFAISYSTFQPNKLKLVLATSTLRTLYINNPNAEKPSYEMLPLEIFDDQDLPLASNSTQMVGSCNGLVCLYTPPNIYLLINPTTGESKLLPDPGTFPTRQRHRLSGFGYDSESGNFMVVSAAIHHDGVFDSVVKVYSANTHSWKTIAHPVRALLHVRHPDQSVFVNGVCHWLGWVFSPEPDVFNDDEDYEAVYKILGFDIANENFIILPVHEDTKSRGRDLGQLGGCLCVLSREPDLSVGMWVMKEYGVAESWVKIFSFNRAYISNRFLTMYPICYAGDKIVFEINHHLYLYDPVNDIATKQLQVNLSEIWSGEGKPQIARYEETPVSPYFPKMRGRNN